MTGCHRITPNGVGPSRGRRHRRRLVATASHVAVLGLAAAGFAGRAAAQNQPGAVSEVVVVSAAKGPLQLTQESSTGSRMGLTPLETPASIQILSGDLIRQHGDLSVIDAEQRATGVSASPTPGNGGQALIARGFAGVTSVMQLYDGVQMFVGAGTVTFPYDPWTVERVEVLSGPASVLYGSGAIGGTVNVVPKMPDMRSAHTDVRAGYGSFNTTRAAIDTTGPATDKLSYRLMASYQTSDGWIERGHNDSTAVSASVRFDALPNLHFILSDDYGLQNPMPYYGEPVINGGVSASFWNRNYNVKDAILHYEDNWTQFKTEWAPLASVTVRNTAYYLINNRQWQNGEFFGYQPASGLLLANSNIAIAHHQWQIGDHADAAWKGKLLSLDNSLAVGMDINKVHFGHVSNSPYVGSTTIPLAYPTPILFNHTSPTTPDYTTTTTQRAFYGEDRITLLPKFSVLGGMRNDVYSLDRFDPRAVSTTKKDFNTTSWRVGGVYEATPTFSLYSQYSQATDPVGSLISLSPAQQIFTLPTGNQVEAGLKSSFWKDRGQFTFAAYHIVKNNILAPDPAHPTVSQQIGQQSSQGLEAALAIDVGAGVHLEANGTVLKAQFDKFGENVGGVVVSRAGNRPPNVPNQTANLFATWQADSKWRLQAGMRYVGERFANNANTIRLPSYAVMDAGLTYILSPKYSIDLRVYNALDKLYAESQYNTGAQWILGRPRSVEVTFNGRF